MAVAEEVALYKTLLHEEILREQEKKRKWIECEQKLIDMLEKYPFVNISVPEGYWRIDAETLQVKPNEEKYKNPRLELLGTMMKKANGVTNKKA